MNTKITSASLALSVVGAAATVNIREAWSGALYQKSLDEHHRVEQLRATRTGGLLENRDSLRLYRWNNPDPNGMDPLPDDTRVSGSEYVWFENGHAERFGKYWRITWGGEYFEEIIPAQDLTWDPIGVSFFSGLMVSEDGRHKTLGGFGYGVENRSAMTKAALVTVDWGPNEILMGHTTTHAGAVPAGELRLIACIPEKDEWALATGQPTVEVK